MAQHREEGGLHGVARGAGVPAAKHVCGLRLAAEFLHGEGMTKGRGFRLHAFQALPDLLAFCGGRVGLFELKSADPLSAGRLPGGQVRRRRQRALGGGLTGSDSLEEGEHAVVVLMRNGVELVLVTPGASQRQP